MKKVAILGVSLTLLFGLNVGAIVPVTASATGPNVTQQEPSQSMTTKANLSLIHISEPTRSCLVSWARRCG